MVTGPDTLNRSDEFLVRSRARRALIAPTALLLLLVTGCRGVPLETRGLTLRTLSINNQPVSHGVMAGQTTTFHVLAEGIGPLHYQWWKNGAQISGATSAYYTTPAATLSDDGSQFQVVVTNWRTRVTSNLATLRVLSPKSDAPALFPVKVSADGRYLVDRQDKPFRIQGDSAWSLIANLTYAEADVYLSNRAAKGFNTVLVNLLEHKFAQGGKGSVSKGVPTNRNGDLPFTGKQGGGAYDGTWGTADFSTPNEPYFAFADAIIDLAAKKGMLVNLAPMFLGFKGGDAGWWADLTNNANTQAVSYKFGLYVGNRYKNRQNVIWVIGGDYFPPSGSEGEARLLKFMQGVKAAGATQLWSGDWSASCLSTSEAVFAPSMDINAVYTYGMQGHSGVTYDEARAGYSYSPPRPAYLKETGYENEELISGDPASVRMYEYYAILGGATAGAFFGNRDVWKFATDHWWFDSGHFGHGPWTTAMESTGAYNFANLGRLLDSVSWYDLIPADPLGTKSAIVAGGGNYGTTDYVAAAVTSDREDLLAYIPPTRKGPTSLTVNMATLIGPADASWFDPSSGKYSELSGGPFPNVATKTFTSPNVNSQGDTDWVLVLRVQ